MKEAAKARGELPALRALIARRGQVFDERLETFYEDVELAVRLRAAKSEANPSPAPVRTARLAAIQLAINSRIARSSSVMGCAPAWLSRSPAQDWQIMVAAVGCGTAGSPSLAMVLARARNAA